MAGGFNKTALTAQLVTLWDDPLPVDVNAAAAGMADALYDNYTGEGSGGITSHLDLTEIGTNTHAQIDTHIADGTIHFTAASISHTVLQDKGTNTHDQIDAHIADGTLHFLESAIDHANILNKGTNTHAQVDSHIADGTLHFLESAIDHTNILNKGTNTHAQLDSHVADGTIHFTAASIDHGGLAGRDDDDHTQYLLLAGRSGQTIADSITINGFAEVLTPNNNTRLTLNTTSSSYAPGLYYEQGGSYVGAIEHDATIGDMAFWTYNGAAWYQHGYLDRSAEQWVIGGYALADQPFPLVIYRPVYALNNGVVLAFDLQNTAGNRGTYASIVGGITDSTSGSEDGFMRLRTTKAGTVTNHITLNNLGYWGQGLGTTDPAYPLDFNLSDSTTDRVIARWRVDGAANDFFIIQNGTSTAGQFLPLISGYCSADNKAGMTLRGYIPSTHDNSGWTGIAALNFDARRSGDSAVTNVPLFRWTNQSTEVGIISADGVWSLPEQAVLRVRRTTTGTLGSSTSFFDFTWNQTDEDQHGSWTGVYWTAPEDGWYHADWSLLMGAGVWASTKRFIAALSKNNSVADGSCWYGHRAANHTSSNTVSTYFHSHGSKKVWLDKGDTLRIKVSQDSGATQSFIATGVYNYFDIYKAG